jgi:hypothetical protein
MKRIFTLLAVMLSFGTAVNAQNSDLQVLNTLKAVDTVKFSSMGQYGKIYQLGFVNNGPDPLLSSDTIFLRNPLFPTQLRLNLGAVGGLPVTDTVYFTDTIRVTVQQTPNPFPWCDSIWAKRLGGTLITDPNLANNKRCVSLRFIQVPNVSVGNVAGAEKGGLSVFPNPANGTLNFSYAFGNNAAASVVLRDLLGKVVLNQDLGKGLTGKQTYSLDISTLQSGTYFLELSTDGIKAVSTAVVK